MKQKWYLQTWLICILFASWLFIIPPIIGVVLLIIQHIEYNKLFAKYGEYDTVATAIEELNTRHKNNMRSMETDFKNRQQNLEKDFGKRKEQLGREAATYRSKINKEKRQELEYLEQLKQEIKVLENSALSTHYNFSDYDGLTSEECKNKLAMLKSDEKEFIQSGSALLIQSEGARKEINDNKKQIIRCFNAECDNVLVNLTIKNIESTRNKISRSFETLNKVFEVDGISMDRKLLEMKLEQLNLVYTYELKRQQEKERQKAIKEQMIEEEKVRREIEREKAKLEKDQMQCNNEVKKLLSYLQKTNNDVEKQLYIDKINELELKIKDLESRKEEVLERETNARAGFVYIISNIGSFGDNVYKIGMTRRLEPMDRVKELSSASVPFEFDVHAMIFSDDAPELENMLHKKFEKFSVNKVNLRKEFFKVPLDEIEKAVLNEYNNTVDFVRVAVATEYRQTLNLLESEAV